MENKNGKQKHFGEFWSTLPLYGRSEHFFLFFCGKVFVHDILSG